MLVSAVVREIYAGGALYVREGLLTICDKIIQIKYLEVKLKPLASALLIVIKHCTFNFSG